MYIYKNKDGRVRAVFKKEDGSVSSKSYPRILMEESLGRPLEPYEEVHHKDGNPSNNELHNLEIVIHGEHQRKHATKYHNVEAMCEVCGKTFMWMACRQRMYYIDLRRGKNRIISCSKRCSSYYGRQEQLRRDS